VSHRRAVTVGAGLDLEGADVYRRSGVRVAVADAVEA
jgi:hypothetical protein